MPSPSTAKSFSLNRSIFQDLSDWAAEAPELLDELYLSPHAVQSVFRALPPIARLYVSRLLFVPQHEAPASIDAFRSCLRRRQRAYDRHDAAVRALKALRVFIPEPGSGKLRLHEGFASQLRKSVAYAVEPVFGGPSEEMQIVDADSQKALAEQLDEFAATRLERILNYMVEKNGMNAPGGSVVRALQLAGILEPRRQVPEITSAGFQFLLKDSFAQLWTLLRSVLVTQFTGERVDVLDLIFKLSFACPGKEYRSDGLSATQRGLLTELHELGIVMLDKSDHSFRPTRIGIRLLSQSNRLSSNTSFDSAAMMKSAGEIEIFVETNFRVYAYTSSNFQTNLLGLFTHLRYQMPGMVVGHLTRDAVRKALQIGITSDQIIGYLNAHAHPRMNKGAMPANVSDEIRLWEAEQARVQTTSGVLLSDFSSQETFGRVMAYGNDVGAVLWSNPSRMQLIVDSESFNVVRNFIQSHGLQ